MFLLCAATAIVVPAQTLTTLFSFDGTDGANLNAAVVQAADGNFYGTTYGGGAEHRGTIFEITAHFPALFGRPRLGGARARVFNSAPSA